MSRGLKWQLPFKSLAGNDCVVKIYAEGFSGTATTLIGGAEPFVLEEDDSKSLLDLVRTTSGYMSVMEEEYGDLDDLFPSTDFQHMVTLEVNGSVQFTGYMQATEYDNDWDRGPRELHFPVMSSLGLMDHYDFPLSLGTPATIYSLRYLLHHVLTTMDCGYEYVYLPGSSLNIDMNVSSLSVVPFNNNFSISGHSENTHQAESFKYLIDGICGAFGWMVHDVPGALVFMKFDYSGEYYRIAVADLIAQDWTYEQTGIYGDDVLAFGDYFTISGNSHRQSLLRPLKEISLSIDGDTAQNSQVSFERVNYEGMSKTPDYLTVAGWLYPMDDDIGGTYVFQTNALDNMGVLQDTGINVADCGNRDSHNKKILICWDQVFDTYYDNPIFFVNLYEPPSGAIEIKFHIQWQMSNIVGLLGNDDYSGRQNPRLVVKLYRDGHPWSQIITQTRYPLVFDDDGYASLLFYTETAPFPYCHKLTVEFYACNESVDGYPGNLSHRQLIALNQISVNSLEGLFSDYTENRTRIESLKGSTASPDAGTLNMPLSFYRENAHLIGLETKLVPQVASFNYMFASKRTLTVKAKAIDTLTALGYAQVVELEGVQYRLISTSYEPREDDWTLLLVEIPGQLPPHPEPPEPPTPVLPYDAEVEYLESTGTQYIDTGILPLQGYKYFCEVGISASTPTNCIFWGSRSGGAYNTSTNQLYCNYNPDPTNPIKDLYVVSYIYTTPYYSELWRSGVSPQVGIMYEFNNMTTSPLHTDGTKAICLFGLYNISSMNTSVATGIKIRRWGCYDASNNLVADFIAVRVGTTGYMYDRVSGELFGNSGTGDFTIGADKN